MAYEGMSPEDIARRFGATIDGGDNQEAVARKFGGRIEGEPLTPMQGAGAVATGFNHSALAGIPGLPAKIGADVIDLTKAAYGYAGSKLGFLTPDEMPPLLDRSKVFLSPEWIAARIRNNVPLGSQMIDNPRPDNPAARVLNAGGAALGSSMAGNPRDAAMQFTSGVAGQTASELGADPAWSMVASMGPQAATTGGAAATRGVARGGEVGRQQMQDRIQQFNAAGVDPTVGLATGNRRTQAIESALAKTPGGAGTMAAKIESLQGGMQGTASAARDNVSSVYGPAAAGDAIKQGITGYRERQQAIYQAMQDRALSKIPEGMTFPVGGLLGRGADTLANVPGAPNVSRVLNQPLSYTEGLLGALNKDAAPQPPSLGPSLILQPNGQPFTTPIPGTFGGLPFAAIKDLKTQIGARAYANNPLLADANTGAMKYLAGGAKQDLLTAGALADAERTSRGQQPGVLNDLQRADRFYTQTQTMLEKTLAPLYKVGDPASERTFLRAEGNLANSGQEVQRMMASLPLDARKQFTATAIDRIGKATPGQQNAEGTAFSPQTFLTNWNRMTPQSRDALFTGIPNGAGVRDQLDAIAKSAAMMRVANKVYANPSGTAGAAALLGQGLTAGGGITAMAMGHPVAGATALSTALGSAALAKFMAAGATNPKFVTWLSQSTALKPEQLQAHLKRLAVNASAEKDPQQRAGLESFVNDLSSELGYSR